MKGGGGGGRLDKNAREVSNLELRPVNHYVYKIRAKISRGDKVVLRLNHIVSLFVGCFCHIYFKENAVHYQVPPVSSFVNLSTNCEDLTD